MLCFFLNVFSQPEHCVKREQYALIHDQFGLMNRKRPEIATVDTTMLTYVCSKKPNLFQI
ncbi:hypothetical protein HK26_06745 [Acetobacter okinawensis]|uniref:Uncharacterized protein n=1 Tax=Acetobacter okinawensis TaxID=1076594 RepID=A0A252BSN1_9PROT|nr:hypothetical protein HK26_06745 [Acetobacter okinawensis]